MKKQLQLTENSLYAIIHFILLLLPFILVKLYMNDCACHYSISFCIDLIMMCAIILSNGIRKGYIELHYFIKNFILTFLSINN